MTEQANIAKELRRQLAGDPHRPQYHFLAPGNWMNDPNGPIQWQGRYHIFYQHNPSGPAWGNIHWGHAASDDLVHWEDLPIALAPTPGSPDEGGCWSGCAVDDHGTPTLIYTGIGGKPQEAQHICLATSRDGLLTWEKHPANPVIPGAPAGVAAVGFRDPCVWREGDTWYQVIGTGIEGYGGAVLLYRSQDLVHWEYLNPLYQRSSQDTSPFPTGYMWECPQFFRLGNRHVLIVSAMLEGRPNYALYFTGAYDDHRFTPKLLHRLDYGGDFYAPITMLDSTGRRILWGWSWEARSIGAQRSAGWAGTLTLPRVLSLRADGRLDIAPAPELQSLREQAPYTVEARAIPAAGLTLLPLRGDCMEIVAEFEPGTTAERFGLGVRCAPGGEEQTLIYYEPLASRLVIDRESASLDTTAHRGTHAAPLQLPVGEPLRLRVFLDRSIIEVYANDWACLTERIYPSRPNSLSIGLFAHGGEARLRSLQAWKMRSIWGEQGPAG